MTRPQITPAERRRYERNIPLFYAFQLACNLALWSSIWVLYLQEMRGLSLTQITALDAPFWVIAILAFICAVSLLIWGRGLEHQRGDEVGSLGVLVVTGQGPTL